MITSEFEKIGLWLWLLIVLPFVLSLNFELVVSSANFGGVLYSMSFSVKSHHFDGI